MGIVSADVKAGVISSVWDSTISPIPSEKGGNVKCGLSHKFLSVNYTVKARTNASNAVGSIGYGADAAEDTLSFAPGVVDARMRC